jgi:N-acetylneuraminic acid mutarotase
MIVWGGLRDAARYYNDGSSYDPASNQWTPTAFALGPEPRIGHSAIWTGNELVIWGGEDRFDAPQGSGGRYDLLTDRWSPTSLVGAPSPRAYHTAVWTGDRMLVWGGRDDTTAMASGATYDPVMDQWDGLSLLAAPEARSWHTALWTGSRMIVWGGRDSADNTLDTGGRYDPDTDSWAPTSVVGAPSGRFRHTAVWTGSRMVIWSGFDDTLDFWETGGRYDPSTDTWTATSTVGVPSGRVSHAALWTGSRMVIWGGWADDQRLNTGGLYDPGSDTWAPTSLLDAPSKRNAHTATWTSRGMIVWDGIYYPSAEGPHGGRYDPSTDTWAPVSVDGAPIARNQHSALWIGTRLLVWGGKPTAGGKTEQAGGLYALGLATDDDGDTVLECEGDCDDSDASTYPGAPQLCDGVQNACDALLWPATGAEEIDDDGDGYVECGPWVGSGSSPVLAGFDCDDTNPLTFPGAQEVNDGLDNQCPGDPGHGVMDETSGDSGFHNAFDKSEYSWPAQDGATAYEVARSGVPDFSADCVVTRTSETYWIDAEEPPAGSGFHYLNRPYRPHTGSWGQDSDGAERTNVCP